MTNGICNHTRKLIKSTPAWLSEVLDWLPQSLAIGGSLGVATTLLLKSSVGFTLGKPKGDSVQASVDYVVSTLSDVARVQTLHILLTSIALWLAGCTLIVGLRARNAAESSFRERFITLNRRCLPVAMLPLVTFFCVSRDTRQFTHLDLTIITLLTVLSGFYAYRATENHWLPFLRRFQPKTERTGFIVLLILWVTYSVWASFTSIIEHWNLGTRIFDLGIYGNTVFNSSQGRLLECTFTKGGTHVSAHFDPILILLSPIYWVYPRVESLLVLQSFWLGAAVIPLYFYAKLKGLGIGESLIVCSAYLLQPSLHGINFFGFHSLALIVPLIVCMLYWLETNKLTQYFVTTLILLTVREDQSLIVSTIGLYALLTRRVKVGLVTLALATAYALLVKFVTMKVLGPSGARTYEYYYGEVMMAGGNGALDLAVSIASNPMLAIATILKLPKIYYFLKYLIPLCFFPLFGGRKIWLLVYGFLFIGLSSRSTVPTVHYQYSALLLPFVMVAAIDGMERVFGSRVWGRFIELNSPMRRAVFAAVFAGSLGTSLAFGAWPSNPGFKAGRTRLERTFGKREADRMRQLRELESQIPANAKLCVDANLGPHLSSRRFISTWPKCLDAQFAIVYKGRLKSAERAALRKGAARGSLVYEDADFVFYETNRDKDDVETKNPSSIADDELEGN
jgi:uncharacterized membrane protein